MKDVNEIIKSIKEKLPEHLVDVFVELENWPTKTPPEAYGDYPDSIRNCIKAVSEGRKPIVKEDLFDGEDVGYQIFCDLYDQYQDILFLAYQRKSKGVGYIVWYAVMPDKIKYFALLDHIDNNLFSFSSEEKFVSYGVIFGYPEEDIKDFLVRRFNLLGV